MKKGLFLYVAFPVSLLLGQPGPPQQSGDGIWLRDALWGEATTFDKCFGHQPPSGMYHHHVQPICLRAQLDDNVDVVRASRTGTVYKEKKLALKHSPILGWSFDGYPIYGPYGYSDSKSASSAVVRIRSSFRQRNITTRTALPDWALAFHAGVPQQLSATQSGPLVSKEYPVGRYVEDYEFVQGLGDLDVYNGRTALTPEFPQGTYAYYVTLNEDGSPAFPYLLGLQYNGAVSGGIAAQIPAGAQDYFGRTSSEAVLNSWSPRNSTQFATAASGWDPSAGPSTTWPFLVPPGGQATGGVTTPTLTDVQRIRFTDTTAYVNSNNLASYTMGPWFLNGGNGGVFANWPSSSNLQVGLPRTPAVAATKRTTGMGPVGIWVNGVAVFNALDGASWSASASADSGGGGVSPSTMHVSAASLEGGPLAPGSLVSAFPFDGAELAAADSTNLGGSIVFIRDSAGVRHDATLAYVSPGQVNYRLPEDVPNGLATAVVSVNGKNFSSGIHVVATYPNLFQVNEEALAAAQVVRIRNGAVINEVVYQASSTGQVSALSIDLGAAGDRVYLILYGTGLGKTTQAKINIGGVDLDAAYAGPQGTYPGLDQYNVLLPPTLAGRGKTSVAVTAAGRASNPVNVTFK